MKKYMKYICAVLLFIGTGAHAWATASIAEGRYELVTDLSTLSAGNKLIIAGTASNELYAAKPFVNSSADKLTVYDLGSWNTTAPTSYYDIDYEMGICEFTLGGSAGAWTFNDGNYTVYLDSDGKLVTTSSSTCSAWEIAMSSNSRLTIKSQKCGNSWTKIYMNYNSSGTGQFRAYTSTGTMYLFKYVPSVTLHDGVGGAHTSSIAIGAYFPNDAAEVPGWAFIDKWATSADQDCYPDYPSEGAVYDPGDASTAGVYYAVYQGTAYGCNYGNFSCKPTAIYVLSQTNPSSGDGVNLVVPDIGCGVAGTTITLTLVINEPGTSYQGATIVRDDNDQAVPFTYDDSGADPIITFDLPASDVTATVNFECPDISGETVTIPTITPVYNTSTSKWEATAAWNAVDGATNYKVQLGNRTTSTTLTSPNPTVVTTSSYTNDAVLKNLTVDNEYRLIVQAYNSCDAAHPTAESHQDFTPHCDALEGTLAIALDEVGTTTANLSWSGATTPAIQTTSGANSSLKYDVQITRTLPLPAGATGGVLDASDVSYTSWEGTGLTTGATYRIDVTAKNACGETMAASRSFKCKAYEDYLFTCADLSLTDEDGTHAPIWITSTAGKMVRSQKALHIEGTGLKPNGAITFTIGGVAANNCASGDVFAIRQANGSAVAADASGNINMDVYVFYRPSVATDGLDLNAVGTAIVATSAEGTVPPAVREYKAMSATLANVAINGRHLPADFVIAAKDGNKWYALPADMAGTGNPTPVEIAVDDINNPTIAYTAASNIYNLYENGTKQYVQLGMRDNVNGSDKSYALWANNSSGSNDIGKNGGLAESSLGGNFQWLLTQTVAAAANAQSTAYTISNPNNAYALKAWFAAGGGPKWGLYAYGTSELRLIPASDVTFTEAYFVEWAQHGGVIEVDAEGVGATSVVAHLGEATSEAITLVQTKAGDAKNAKSKYNYTVNFGGSIDFAAATSNGALLTLEWKNGATTKAMTSLVVPKIIASTSTLSSHGATDGDWSSAEVHVLPGVTLTANAGDFTSNDVMIRHLEIYPGATVVVTKGSQASGTLKVKTLVLRNGWTRAGEKAYDVARLYITPSTASLAKNAGDDVWYADWYIDYDQYYPIAVPWDVTIANITYRYCSVEPTVGHDKNIRLRYYDGEGRASSGQSQIGQNWKLYGATGAESVPAKLEPSKGYALTAKRPSGKAFSILRMPLTIPSADWTAGGEKGEVGGTHKDQVSVTGWGKGTAEWYAMGWNFIGNPYMCTFNGNDGGIGGKLELQNGGSIKYATIPDVDFRNYDQVAIADANLKPASGFFVQANDAEAQTITFNASKIVPPSAPARYTAEPTAIPEQEAYIRLSYEGGKDQMGLIIGEDYTENYEVNADLAKVLGDAGFVKTYMQYGGMDMAYVAINEMLAKEWIPVTVILPANGEYTYSLTNSSIVDELEGVYLIDYANNDQITNLIDENYTFTAETTGTINNRFAINAKVGERETPTDIDVVNGGGDLNSDKPFKFIYHEKVYIYHRGVIYDATGKKVK